MGVHPNQDWLDRSNSQTLYHLERQGRTGPGLVPFLGAGISTTYKFKDWKSLLLGAAPPNLVASIEQLLSDADYEGAAERLLEELGADGFQNMVAAAAGDSNLESFDFRLGMVSLLPLLAGGPVVTTNFDRVLERAFDVNGAPFESVISGPRPDLITDALHGHRRVLIKLHGDWQDRVGRTFSRSDYDANYGDAQPEKKRELLEGVERLLFSSRSLLFIGASLGPDRTVKLLEEVHRGYAGIRHFAIMRAPTEPDKFSELEQRLRNCGILPLWYHAEAPEQHAPQVEKLVETIVERVSVRTIPRPGGKEKPPSSTTAGPDGKEQPPSFTTAAVSLPLREAALPELDAHFDRVVRLIEDGRLTFFLGAAIHYPALMMAEQFYRDLARTFGCEALGEERYAVAQYIADRFGREELYAEIRKLFARIRLEPRVTHEMFAAWKQYRTPEGKPVPFPVVITTNYDDVLERSLVNAGLPYHLLSYQADGPDRGLFYHRSPDDALRVIERPRNIRSFPDGFVLVKLNGGFDRQQRIPQSYATTRLDYWDLAARIPQVLPAAIQRALSAKPILFLGHGLVAEDIESLVRFAHRDHRGARSWAVVLNKDGVEYWRQCGVEILSYDVSLYVGELRRRLLGNGSPVPPEMP